MRSNSSDRRPRPSRRRWIWPAAMVILVAIPTAAVSAQSGRPKWDKAQAFSRINATDAAPNYDVRETRSARQNFAAPSARRRAAQSAFRRSLGAGGVVRIDPVTGTPAFVANRTGFLTGKTGRSARAAVLDYVGRHSAVFGLDRGDLKGLVVLQRYTTKRGLTHIELVQRYRGISAFDNGLRANLVGGRLVNVSGSPQPDLSVASTTPKLSAASAVRRALGDVGVRRSVEQRSQKGVAKRTVLTGRNMTTLVLFVEGKRVRLAWNVIAMAKDDEVYRTLLDAANGEILKRSSLVAHASGSVFLYYPGAPNGGSQGSQTFSTAGDDAWLTRFDRLEGDNVHSYSDPDDIYHLSDISCTSQDPRSCSSSGTQPAAGDEIPPSTANAANSLWNFTQVVDTSNSYPGDRFCPPAGCTWYGGAGGIDPADYDAPFVQGNNWQQNRRQNGTQVHFFVNNFHDFTQNDPGIQFDDASGNFEETANGENPGDPAAPVGGDSVRAQVDDGANTCCPDFPDDNHENNANMLTLPEKDQSGPMPLPLKAPQMQMFLFSDFACSNVGGPCGIGINDVNGGDDAAILYHEFVHGLSNRLVDPFGIGGLQSDQGGAMGEAWSDVYAMDYLNAQNLQPDPPASRGDVAFGTYEGMEGTIRTQGLDCPAHGTVAPGPVDNICRGGHTPYYGGYTYGDFGNVVDVNDDGFGDPEVHADGEIWGETLWDLRQTLISALGTANGQFTWRALVTDGMRLSPADPDVLDFLAMRDAILQANTVDGFGQANCERIWDVFAHRGMGSDASAGGGSDVSPVQGFTDPGPAGCAAAGGGGGGTGGGGGGGGGGGVTPPAKANLASAKGSIRVSRTGRFSYSFRAQAGLGGNAVFKTRKKAVVSRRAHVTISRKSFTVPASGKVTLRIKLSRKNLRILKRNRRLLLRVTVTVRNSAGSAVSRKNLTLRAPRR
jgi:extracellular elastinolytic metalloproteinase